MVEIKKAINKTIAYSRFFNFPLSPKEIYYWLISSKAYPYSKLKPFLPQKMNEVDLNLRLKLKEITNKKTQIALHSLSLMKFFPTIKLVALTGSVAIGNPDKDDDIDFIIITSSDTLWLTRILFIPLVSLFFKRRRPKIANRQSNSFCFNLWLDQSSLSVPKKKMSLYTAHEVLQIKPLFDRDNTYAQFILSNSWTKKYLSNAYLEITQKFTLPEIKPPTKRFFFLIYILNKLAYRLQRFYMAPKITRELVTFHQAFFHPRDLTSTINHYLSKKTKKHSKPNKLYLKS